MSNSKIITPKQWLELMKKPFVPTMTSNTLVTEDIVNPTGAFANSSYMAQAEATASDETSPQSIFEGLQTIADLARVAAGFNPLDPGGNGDAEHFFQFAQNLKDLPFLEIYYDDPIMGDSGEEVNPYRIIDHFIAHVYLNISRDDEWEIRKSLTPLIELACSFNLMNPGHCEFGFIHNLLQPYDNGVEFHLYYCERFSIREKYWGPPLQLERYYDFYYQFCRIIYRLSQESWENIRPELEDEVTISTEDWLNSMTTPPKEGSTLQASTIF